MAVVDTLSKSKVERFLFSIITKSKFRQLRGAPATLINNEYLILPRKTFVYLLGFIILNSLTAVDYFTYSSGLLNALNMMNQFYIRKF